MKKLLLILCFAFSAFAGSDFYATRTWLGDSLPAELYLICTMEHAPVFQSGDSGKSFTTQTGSVVYPWEIASVISPDSALAYCLIDPEHSQETTQYRPCTWIPDAPQIERRIARPTNERPRYMGKYDVLGRRLSNPMAADRIISKYKKVVANLK